MVKKFLSLLAAGSIALSLTAVTVSAESDTAPTVNTACEAKPTEAAKTACLRAHQLQKFKKLNRAPGKAAVQAHMFQNRRTKAAVIKIPRRLLEQQQRDMWKVRAQKKVSTLKSSSSVSSVSSSRSSVSSSSTMSSAASSN